MQTTPRLAWLEDPKTTVAAVILIAAGLLALFGALVLVTPLTSGQGAAFGGAAVLTGGALTYINGLQNRRSEEKRARKNIRVEKKKLTHAQKELTHAQKDAKKQRASFNRTFNAQQTAQKQAAKREDSRDLRARFTSATEQLGSQALATRLAGVYALAALADDWFGFDHPKERQVCIDLLCANVRRPKDDFSAPSSDDEQVRATIIAVIADRTRIAAEPGEDEGPWQDCSFDFSHARVGAISLMGCRFRGKLDFRHTEFAGHIDMTGSIVDFALFSDASFGTASFRRASFRKRVDFTRAIVSNSADFVRTRFHGVTDFSNVTVDRGRMSFANSFFLLGSTTNFRSINLKGPAHLKFDTAWFKGGEVELRNATVDPDARMTFRSPQQWRKAPRVDWEDEEATLPSYLEPRSWPPPLFSSLGAEDTGSGPNDDAGDGEGID